MTSSDATNGGRGAAHPGAGMVLRLIRGSEALTRADLARITGLARSTVTQRVDALIARNLILEAGDSESTGGRRPAALAFNHQAGVVLVADLGATHSHLAVSDLAGTPLAEVTADKDIRLGPEQVLGWVDQEFESLLAQAGRRPDNVRGIGVGVPGPVDFSGGQPVNPPIMPGWDDFSIPGWFADRRDAPVLVDNDVNIMALGEYVTTYPECEHLLFVKVGTGIGCGIVAGGRIHRGGQGAAGDIGHIRVSGRDEVVCHCGNVGCLEAVAGGHALAVALTEAGVAAANSRDIVDLVRGGNPVAVRLVREAGRSLGEVLAGCVNFFNPEVVVIGGDMAEAHEQLLAGVREVTFQRSLPLATRDLQTVPSRLGDRAGVIGAAVMVIEHVLAPAAIDRLVQGAAVAAASAPSTH